MKIMEKVIVIEKIELSAGAGEVLAEMQKEVVGTEFTIAMLKVRGVAGANPSHLTKLVKEGLAVRLGEVSIECKCCGNKRKVLAHALTEKGMNYQA